MHSDLDRSSVAQIRKRGREEFYLQSPIASAAKKNLSGETEKNLQAGLAEAERISAEGGGSFCFASQFFEDRARYDAFVAMYAAMRVVEDAIDNAPNSVKRSAKGRHRLHALVNEWQKRIDRAYAGEPEEYPLEIALAWAVDKFPAPHSLWNAFLDAMRFVIDTPRFTTFKMFLHYAEGAAVAPATIYLYLLTSEAQSDGTYRVLNFDYARCGRDLGLFAYTAHVLRDIKKNLESPEFGLVRLAEDDMAAHGLNEQTLRCFVRAGSANHRFDYLADELITRARRWQRNGLNLARKIWPSLPADRNFIFRVTVRTYSELLTRIEANPQRALVTDQILNGEDDQRIADAVAAETGFQPQKKFESSHVQKDRADGRQFWLRVGSALASLRSTFAGWIDSRPTNSNIKYRLPTDTGARARIAKQKRRVPHETRRFLRGRLP